MRMCIERKDDFDVLRDGEQSTDLNVRDYTISTALYQGTMPLEAISGARCSLMNIWLPKELWHLRPERSLRNELRILKDTELELSANFAPAGTFVDIHIDQNRHALYKSGSYGALFKVRLSSHGWAGFPLTESSNIDQQAYMMIQRSLQAIHSQGVLHGDAEPRNILWNNISHRPMIVDFGRASMRRPLANVSPNTIGKKPNHAKNEKPFMLERQAMQHSLEALAQKVEELKI
ncbi:hypothetical protein D8B26_005403 [Coccidioides posadasii str. Silveira]|nr:hypothetical protein D8B26_005403 [Coccidioides posadasii str. Silveira]